MPWEVIFALVTGTLTGLALAYATAQRRRVKKLQQEHRIQLMTQHAKGYSKGFDDAQIMRKISVNIRYGKNVLQEPELGELVQHCNSRTDYEFIAHPYDPDNCEHCLDIRHVVMRSN